eukprot:1159011-Pelagomonas_calceolata.AAC.2
MIKRCHTHAWLCAGILEVRLVYEGRSHSKLCEGDDVPGCTFDIQIPIQADEMDPDQQVKCVRLEPYFGTHMFFEPISNMSWVHPLESQTPNTITCTVDMLGGCGACACHDMLSQIIAGIGSRGQYPLRVSN